MSIGCARILVVGMTAFFLAATSANDPEDSRPRLSWHDYERIASLIALMPEWPTQGTLQQDEWKRLAELASALQFLAPEDVEISLIVYMAKYCGEVPEENSRNDPRTKPLLLLGMMFDKSQSRFSIRELRAIWETSGAQTCGGFDWQVVGSHQSEMDMFQFPIKWSEQGPVLMATRLVGVSGTGPPKSLYQPHIEFGVFRRVFEPRSTFEPLLDGKVGSWRLLWRRWIFDAAIPATQRRLRSKYRDR